MEPYHIPANYTDAGRLLGLFELRNAIEAAVVVIPLLLLSFHGLPFGITTKCVAAMILSIPAGGFALIGWQEDCLSRFLLGYGRWRRGRKILRYPKGGRV